MRLLFVLTALLVVALVYFSRWSDLDGGVSDDAPPGFVPKSACPRAYLELQCSSLDNSLWFFGTKAENISFPSYLGVTVQMVISGKE